MNAIQKAVEACGSQAALARRLEVSAPTVQHWIKYGARQKHWERICAASENRVSTSDFLADLAAGAYRLSTTKKAA